MPFLMQLTRFFDLWQQPITTFLKPAGTGEHEFREWLSPIIVQRLHLDNALARAAIVAYEVGPFRLILDHIISLVNANGGYGGHFDTTWKSMEGVPKNPADTK
jgi:hypothetical protein